MPIKPDIHPDIHGVHRANLFLTGSAVWFTGYKDFKPKDYDFIRLATLNNPNYIMKAHHDLSNNKNYPIDIFIYNRKTPEEYIQYSLNCLTTPQIGGLNQPMHIAAFLTPVFCTELGFTIEHLKQLEPITLQLDNRHKYLKTIFNFYIANNDFILTPEQRDIAYAEYKQERNI